MTLTAEIKKGDFVVHKGSVMKVTNLIADINDTSFSFFDFTTGSEITESISADHIFNKAELESVEYKLVKRNDETFVFYNEALSEYIDIAVSILGENVKFLRDEALVNIRYCNGLVASVELPKIVIQEIEITEDIEKDSTNTEFVKEARLVNGKTILVPAFIKNGDRVKIDIDTGEYISRE